jgi:hypothetical protein
MEEFLSLFCECYYINKRNETIWVPLFFIFKVQMSSFKNLWSVTSLFLCSGDPAIRGAGTTGVV